MIQSGAIMYDLVTIFPDTLENAYPIFKILMNKVKLKELNGNIMSVISMNSSI